MAVVNQVNLGTGWYHWITMPVICARSSLIQGDFFQKNISFMTAIYPGRKQLFWRYPGYHVNVDYCGRGTIRRISIIPLPFSTLEFPGLNHLFFPSFSIIYTVFFYYFKP